VPTSFLRELQHRVLLAMDQEGDPRRGFPLPFEKFRLVSVAGKPVDGVNACPHRMRLAKPVTFPLGRSSRATMLLTTGSPTPAKTIGIVGHTHHPKRFLRSSASEA
jgi:hypothetical protein